MGGPTWHRETYSSRGQKQKCWITYIYKKDFLGGARVALWVELPALDLGSGHDLEVHGIKPGVGLHADSTEPAWDSLFLFLSLPAPLPLTLAQNK